MKTLQLLASFAGMKKNIGSRARKFFWALGRHAFLVILVITMINIALGGVLFYRYVFLAKHQPLERVPVIRFQESTYQSLMNQQAEKAAAFAEQSQMQYTDPFR